MNFQSQQTCLLTAEEVAGRFHVTADTARGYMRRMPHVKIPGSNRIFVRESDLLALINDSVIEMDSSKKRTKQKKTALCTQGLFEKDGRIKRKK